MMMPFIPPLCWHEVCDKATPYAIVKAMEVQAWPTNQETSILKLTSAMSPAHSFMKAVASQLLPSICNPEMTSLGRLVQSMVHEAL